VKLMCAGAPDGTALRTQSSSSSAACSQKNARADIQSQRAPRGRPEDARQVRHGARAGEKTTACSGSNPSLPIMHPSNGRHSIVDVDDMKSARDCQSGQPRRPWAAEPTSARRLPTQTRTVAERCESDILAQKLIRLIPSIVNSRPHRRGDVTSGRLVAASC
jgi:hypothetical protein